MTAQLARHPSNSLVHSCPQFEKPVWQRVVHAAEPAPLGGWHATTHVVRATWQRIEQLACASAHSVVHE